jgi:hypothetical protein
VRIELEKDAVLIRIDDFFISRLEYGFLWSGRIMRPRKISLEKENQVFVEFEGAEIKDVISESDGLVTVDRNWTINRPGRGRLSFTCEVVSPGLTEWTVPSVMYDENRLGEGKYPRGGLSAGWSFREDRTPLPACSIVHDRTTFQAVFTEPARSEDEVSSVKSELKNGLPFLQIQTPMVEEPHTYTEKGVVLGGLTRRKERFFKKRRDEAPFLYRRRFYVAYGRDLPLTTYIFDRVAGSAMELAGFGEPFQGQADWGDIADLKLRHLLFLAVDDLKSGVAGFRMGRGNGLIQGYYEYLIGSFLGKNIEASVILTQAGRELERPDLIDLAERVGRFFLQGRLPGGGHRDMYNLRRKSWASYAGPNNDKTLLGGVNARCNGELMINYLRLNDLLDEQGRQMDEIKDMVKANVDFYLTCQLVGDQDGSFGRWWTPDGAPINTLGTNGAYVVSMLVEYAKRFGPDERVTNALMRAAQYYGRLVDENAFYADTLDADCVDKEAGVALLRAFLDLHDWDPRPEYLENARRAAGFILGWTWLYDVAFLPRTRAGRAGLRTTGLTAVSVAHHHLDFYGLMIGYDFLRLHAATGESRYKRYAMLMIDACRQLISRPGRLLGRSEDFAGWQPEQINQTDWDYIHHWFGAKGKFHICVAWNVVLTLGAILDIREKFPEVMNFKLTGRYLRD